MYMLFNIDNNIILLYRILEAGGGRPYVKTPGVKIKNGTISPQLKDKSPPIKFLLPPI